jgi:microcystin-dependent protein
MSKQYLTGINGPPVNSDLLLQPQGGTVVMGSTTKVATADSVGLKLQGLDKWDYGPGITFYSGAAHVGVLNSSIGGMYLSSDVLDQNMVTTIDGTKELKLRTRVPAQSGDLTMLKITQTDVISTLPVTLPRDPTAALQAATKQYVDANVGGGGGGTGWNPGDLKTTIATVAPAGWLMLDGTSIPNGDTTYPDLWAVAPASWKSGTTLVLPNAADCVLMGGGTLGSVGGSNSRTLTMAELPVHAHSAAHAHGFGGITGNAGAHTHTINHDHAQATTSAVGDHRHAQDTDNAVGSDVTSRARGTAPPAYTGNYGGDYAGGHSHTVNLPSFSGSSGSAGDHFHDIADFTGNTGNAGSGTALDITPKNFRINIIVKT